MRTTRALPILLALLVLTPAAHAGKSEAPELFLRLALDYRPESRKLLPEIRDRLDRELPGLLRGPLPRCPLRSALAKGLAVEEVRKTLVALESDPKGTAIYVANLAARPDLAALVLQSGVPDRVEGKNAKVLLGVALNSLLDGDSRLTIRLLASSGVDDIVERLCLLSYPDGLQFLADVVTGTVEIPADARARLAVIKPTFQDDWPAKPLGAERAAALVRTAESDPDHAMRALAARLLLRSNDPATAALTARAFVAANSVALDDGDWHDLGKLAPEPVIDPSVSIEHRLDMFESWQLWTWDRAEQDVLAAEARAAALRPALARAEPRLRGEMIVEIEAHIGIFIATVMGRQRAVPSFVAILEDLAKGRRSDAPELLALGRSVATRVRSELSEEDGWPKVRVRETELAAESAWRPAPRDRETVLADVVDLIRTPGQFTEALAFLENRKIPAAARLDLFEGLMGIVRDGPELEEEEEDEDDPPFDPSYFVAVEDWIVKHAASLDAGLPEAVLECFVVCPLHDASEALCPRQTAAFHRAVARVPAGGARIRLFALQEQVRAWGE